MNRSEMGADELRELFQGRPRKAAANEECPSPEEIWASARGELSPEENRRVIDHTGGCPSCAEDWRLARFVARRAAGGIGDRSSREPSRRWLAAAAAVLVAALGGTSLFLWQTREPETVYRDQPQEAIESLAPEDQPLSRADPTLRWSGPEGATYSLELTTTRLKVVIREEGLTETEYTLPGSVVVGIEPGTVLLWHVEATLPDGTRVPSQTFRVVVE